MLQRIVAIYKIKRKYDKLTDKASIILAAIKGAPVPLQANEHCVLW